MSPQLFQDTDGRYTHGTAAAIGKKDRNVPVDGRWPT